MSGKENFFKTSDGVWLYLEISGEGKPLLLLPGFGESTTMWRHSVPVFSERYQVINLDLRGHGRSMKAPGTNRQERMAQDIRELIDYLELQDVLLIGHSLGGAVAAYEFTRRARESGRSVVTSNKERVSTKGD